MVADNGSRIPLRRALAIAFAAAVLWFGGRTLLAQWEAVRGVRAAHPVQWGGVLFASVLTLGSYAVLIETWRRTVAAWGGAIGYAAAARIWLVSNLGRYVPGKIWQIGAMSVLAERAGTLSVISPVKRNCTGAARGASSASNSKVTEARTSSGTSW